MANITNPQKFTANGLMVWTCLVQGGAVEMKRKLVQQVDGSFFHYYKRATATGWGTPTRGASRQPHFVSYKNEIEAALK